MELMYIKSVACPKCGESKVVAEDVEVENRGEKRAIRTHAHGGNWESRTFLCGYKTEYIPNFSREEPSTRSSDFCRYDQKIVEEKQARKAYAEKVIAYIKSFPEVDKAYVEEMERSIKGVVNWRG